MIFLNFGERFLPVCAFFVDLGPRLGVANIPPQSSIDLTTSQPASNMLSVGHCCCQNGYGDRVKEELTSRAQRRPSH